MRVAAIVGVLVSACVSKPTFHCTTSAQCGTGAVCESVGYCSFVDPGCAAGRRFGDLSGPDSNQCVGAGGDGGVGSDGNPGGDCWAAWKQGTIAFASVKRIPELVNAAAQEHASLSGDDLTLYFDRSVPGRARDFYAATRTAIGQPFGAATAVSELDTTFDEERLTVSANGTYAVFASTRAGGTAMLWDSARPSGTGAFGTPDQADLAQVNVNPTEFDPQLSRDALHLYHAPVISGGNQVIAVSSRTSTSMPFGAPVTLSPLSINGIVGDPSVSPDELVIVFAANQGLGRAMYYASRSSTSSSFGTPKAVPGVSPGGTYDGNSAISSNGCELFFVSDRTGLKELYLAVAQ